MNPRFSVCLSQKPKQHRNQINTNSSAHSNRSTVVSDQDTHCETALPSQIPTVSFDLGNEWDDWGDFDDENLVHANETSFASCAANDKPQIQQSVEFNVPGNVMFEFPCLRNSLNLFVQNFVIHLVVISYSNVSINFVYPASLMMINYASTIVMIVISMHAFLCRLSCYISITIHQSLTSQTLYNHSQDTTEVR